MISVVCYLWDGPRRFLPAYVNVLSRAVAHHLTQPHRFVCVTAGPDIGFAAGVDVVSLPRVARPLLDLPSPEGDRFPASYARLWTFSAEAAEQLGPRVLLLDVDCMITGDLSMLLKPMHDFVGWRVRPPPGGPQRFGGGTWMLRTGTRTNVWDGFIVDPLRAIRDARQAGYRGSDQAWISYCLSEREYSWPDPSGIYCAQDYRKKPKPPNLRLLRRRGLIAAPVKPLQVPPDAIVLHMNGHEKPWTTDDPIVRKHWHPFVRPEDLL